MIKQTPDNNNILRYHAEIEIGTIIVCKKIWKVYNHLAERVNATDLEYYYSAQRGDHIVNFFEQYLRHSKGKLGGKKVKLEIWEKALLNAQYGFISIEGIRQYNRCIFIVGKKNGKSFISSGEGLYLLSADGEAGPEVYSTATKRDQARIIWDESRRMRNKSPVLKKRIKATVNELKCEANDGVF
jgi:phage terminase large subunit-like protein